MSCRHAIQRNRIRHHESAEVKEQAWETVAQTSVWSPGRRGGTGWCRLVLWGWCGSPELEQVVGGADQVPLAVGGGEATAEQPRYASGVFDLPEDGFDGLAAFAVEGLAALGSQLALHPAHDR